MGQDLIIAAVCPDYQAFTFVRISELGSSFI